MPHKFTNNASSLLDVGITDIQTNFTVAEGTGDLFPTIQANSDEYAYVTLEDATGLFEIVKATSRQGDNFICQRAQEGTTAQSWSAGTRVEVRFTAGAIMEFVQKSGDTIDGNTNTLIMKYSSDPNTDPTLTQTGELAANVSLEGPRLYLRQASGAVKTLAEPTYEIQDSVTPPAFISRGALGFNNASKDLSVWWNDGWQVTGYSTKGGDIQGSMSVVYNGVTYMKTSDDVGAGNPPDLKGMVIRNIAIEQALRVGLGSDLKGDVECGAKLSTEGDVTVGGALKLQEEAEVYRIDQGGFLSYIDSTTRSGGRVYTGYADSIPPQVDDLEIGDLYFEFEGNAP